MTTPLYPMTFTPVLKDYVWGGRSLETRLGRRLPPEGVIAESWEIAAHEDGTSTVDNGPLAGQPLTAVHAALGLDLIGRRNAWAQARGKFPLLIKLLDAATPLSVQVHPDDAYALAHEGNELGKTEMWVVLHAEPGSELILGVTAGTTPEAFRAGILEGSLEPFLHRVPVKAGDHVCVPAGTLHAIMGGLLIVEIQQNSNTTYRVYDWNRVDASGRPRPLHVDKALDVINFEQVAPGICPPVLVAEGDGVRRWELCRNRYFVTERVELAQGAVFRGCCDGTTLEIWGVLTGGAAIGSLTLDAVRFALLPAALGEFVVVAQREATLLRTYVD
ncbi:MAG: class I mannose-6-phosphate isomerase [Anaerolineae bacterium]|nr:class I mannose-6-phosphate isomerase [Anaerolineae bacterium]